MREPVPPDIRVRLDELARRYEEGGKPLPVLTGVTVDIRSGETVALRGRSGSGKSTLLNLIAGLDQPDAGRVYVSGRNLTAMNDRERTLFRRQHIGFVYQAFNLVPTLTVADNIRLVLELNGVARARADERIKELLEAVELSPRATAYPEQLSGGEQQRVAIARAVAHRPQLLLADEPTGNLDDRSAEGVMQLLHRLKSEEGATLLIATHSAAIANQCERVLDLRGGTLIGHD